MSPTELKEANRIFWMVKHHLIPCTWSEETIADMVNDYIRRLWCNNEAYQYEEGFEEAYDKYLHEQEPP